MTTTIAFAVTRRHDETARAIFASHDDASAFADTLNQKVPFALAFAEDGLRHLWTVQPRTIAKNTLEA